MNIYVTIHKVLGLLRRKRYWGNLKGDFTLLLNSVAAIDRPGLNFTIGFGCSEGKHC